MLAIHGMSVQCLESGFAVLVLRWIQVMVETGYYCVSGMLHACHVYRFRVLKSA